MTNPNHDEFEKLFRNHHKALHNLAFNLVRDSDAAKDIVQEVFAKLWQNRKRLEFGEQIRHYLFKATSHTALNYLRTSRKFIPAENEHFLHLLASPGLDDMQYQELELRVRAAIDKLPPKCKLIYLLSRQEGLKYQEIADTLDISVKTVENQMGIALEKLRDDLRTYLPHLVGITSLLAALWYLLMN
jgi:RNA polymerase sigma-70 factor (ECF subfamily)